MWGRTHCPYSHLGLLKIDKYFLKTLLAVNFINNNSKKIIPINLRIKTSTISITAFAEYILVRPADEYASYMNAVAEKICMSKVCAQL